MRQLGFLALAALLIGASWYLPTLLGQSAPTPAAPSFSDPVTPAPVPTADSPESAPRRFVRRPEIDASPGARPAQPRGYVPIDPNRIRGFVLKTVDKVGEAQIAVEEGGVLKELTVNRGSVVKAGQILGRDRRHAADPATQGGLRRSQSRVGKIALDHRRKVLAESQRSRARRI
ncbi:MAG: hypothetical protein QM811_17750 [Pirellulales bacterium]